MSDMGKYSITEIGYNFIPGKYLPEGGDEYYFRNARNTKAGKFRRINSEEVKELIKNGNASDSWENVYIEDPFDTSLIKNSQFYGLVRIGSQESHFVEFHDLKIPAGIFNSTIISCDLGSNVSIRNVHYLSHFIIGNDVILFNIDEMLTTNHAKFGNGILKDDEDEKVRIWLEVGNENGGRKILPFENMLPGDAFLWSKFRANPGLMSCFKEMTEKDFDRARGYYGEIGDRTIIKSCRILKDVKVGTDAYIKGANKLKNLTIKSSRDKKTQIGEGVELVNGIINYGCRIFYGVKAIRFFMGENSSLKYGARLINSVLGDNATISCCEVLNSLIFPGHEQHHNNSFLCSAVVMGQSNIPAGATIGSNHNSRSNDGEIIAKRGFWPGLCTSLKHNSRFASFTMLVKDSYPAELDIRLPFSLVSISEEKSVLQIMPAYWFMYNMYALSRNSMKYKQRDGRTFKTQHLEFDYLAPDTVEEIFYAIELLELWTGRAFQNEKCRGKSEEEIKRTGKDLLLNSPEKLKGLEIVGEKIEASKRKVVILKTPEAYRAYREMINFYSVKTIVSYMYRKKIDFSEFQKIFFDAKRGVWVNVGGQLIPEEELNLLLEKIIDKSVSSWRELHSEYERLGKEYEEQKAAHAFCSLLEIHDHKGREVKKQFWKRHIEEAEETLQSNARKILESREKDYSNYFRKIPYSSTEEMEAVLGKMESNDFIKKTLEDEAVLLEKFKTAKSGCPA